MGPDRIVIDEASMSFIEVASRDQACQPPPSVEDYVASHAGVRVVDAFVAA
jgi:hypothetical protein